MKQYEPAKMHERLKELGKILVSHEQCQVAADEKISYPTLQNYYKGNIPSYALAQAIIDRSEYIVANRENEGK